MTITLNNVNPATVGAILDSKSGLRVTPTRRGGNIALPLLDGAVFRPQKRYDESTVVLRWVIAPYDPVTKTRTLATKQHHVEKNISDFIRLISRDTVVVRHTRADGSVRKFTGEVQDVVEFSQLSKSPKWHAVSVNFKVIGAFWEAESMTAIPSFGLVTNASRVLTELADAEARMSNMIITWGPSSNPRLWQGSTGIYVQYNGVIAAGQVLNVNTQTGQLTTTGGTAWTPNAGNIIHSGDSRYFSLVPEPDGSAPNVTVQHTGGGSMQTSLSVRKTYMTG